MADIRMLYAWSVMWILAGEIVRLKDEANIFKSVVGMIQ